ncbi:UDP-N-acetylglucosamine 2-epimerase [Clostridium perfringens]|uniref:UDP-N-acetylglucosamine 2-epimerase n=3 Tax=Clostridium perfringens TaxID=1502 RepID=UPI002209AB87|nr:UDP-N-acetylglucosamine 2-epimerase [Clostridium perfringens]ELC8425422.1 UDP-N-acetylglucosamine 2-epimerase (hydrolyzing) [Clostridium perfringens]ELC8426489.1 UDP-N-acetylglucosamine 2-epimerase (hydrolyzing) [Clostridium perfringens]MDK0762780.1 UDP-N-acetylglucosamine 2-epimerase [Clostridium perfringens]MDM0958178.1 UDP-N-acetylglucosamine 2-epimerase [Clostridium perfringens]MDM1009642.1 UDP-N-acetylglucosamine 2-epimerase [Clostridium perfringens]
MGKYKVAYATGSRADYGIVRTYLQYLNKDQDIEFSVLVTGSHLEEKYGYSIEHIKKDGFHIGCEIPLQICNGSNSNVIHNMSIALDNFGSFFEKNQYDLLIILGDRYEMMSVAIAASIHNIPILHLHGGETTYGNYDEFIRHCITKMSRYHFTSTDIYRRRVIQLGEAPERVFYLGALGAENCKNLDQKKVISKVLNMPSKQYCVVAFHPETLTGVNIDSQVKEVLKAIDSMIGIMEVVFIGTNADTNSDVIRNKFLKYVSTHKQTHYFENLNVESFLWLVKNSIAIVGNSSAGIIEAPSLGVYTINIGDRQRGRVHGDSVIDVNCDKDSIVLAMRKIYELSKTNSTFNNPYYLENTAERYFQHTKKLLQSKSARVKEFYDFE